MNRNVVLLFWALAAALQWGVVAKMIKTQETILREGVAYRFRTAPVDPYDAFRGRYVSIALEPRQVEWPEGARTFKRNEFFYVTLATDTNGYAMFTGASETRPAQGDYLRVRRGWQSESNRVGVVHLVDRYYLPEDEAPRAEQLYREHSRSGQQDAYVILRVRRGEAVAEDLVVAGRPIRELLREE